MDDSNEMGVRISVPPGCRTYSRSLFPGGWTRQVLYPAYGLHGRRRNDI